MLLLLLLACPPATLVFTGDSASVDSRGGAGDSDGADSEGGDGDGGDDTGGDTAPDEPVGPGPGEAWASEITDDAALFGGAAAEGRVGDFKLENALVRFVIQGAREGNGVADQGGVVIDADITRPAGQPGRDLVDEWLPMVGFGHLMRPERVEVVDDGRASGRAVIAAEGPASVLDYINGALEDPGFVPDLEMTLRVEYALAADSPLLEVTTTITAGAEDLMLAPGDAFLGAAEAGQTWSPGAGLNAPPDEAGWYGFVSDRNEVAVAVMAAPGELLSPNGAFALLGETLPVASAFTDELEIAAGGAASWTRLYGVGRDPAQLSDAWLALSGEPTEVVEGQVTAPDGPVAGARVSVLVDEAPFTLAFSDAEGRFSARVPEGAKVRVFVDGRGRGLYTDLPAGAGAWSPYAGEAAREAALASLADGAEPIPRAEGRGVSGEDPLQLGEPAWLTLSSGDGLPFEARLIIPGEDYSADPRLTLPRPGGYAAVAWARDGEVRLPVEPGTYNLVAWRGPRHELHQESITVEAGQELALAVSMPAAYEAAGWRLADLHAHAGPSSDGQITSADRLTVAAGVGLEIYTGSDHDHAVDFGPLLAPLGLSERLALVVADEASPVIRGHLNAYPIEADAAAINGGAWRWWLEQPETTDAVVAALRERHPEALIQMNHPLSGVASAAGWSPGAVDEPDLWTEDVDALEVLNAGNTDAVDLFLDLTNRGVLTAPVGVSDSHGYTSGAPGLSATWVHTGEAGEALAGALRDRQTVASRGPFLELSTPPGAVVSGALTLEVRARAPSWIVVDELRLLRDGEVVEEVQGDLASFTLSPEVDASYVVVARGDQPMSPLSSATPWALSAPIFVDVEGDGWTAPLPPIASGQ